MNLFDRSGKLCGPELDRRAALCQECMSEHCIFNPEGICIVPVLYGRATHMTEDDCLDWKDNEKE